MGRTKPLVFLDVCIDGYPQRRMIFELFTDVAPKTAENFRALCTGEKGISDRTGKPLHYKGTLFHRIVKGSMAQAGDFLRQDGNHGESIYGTKFPDEPPKLKHDAPGLLSMAIADRDTRGSLFTLTFSANHNLDRKYVVFGKLLKGHDVLKKIENVGNEEGKPDVMIKIIDSGEFPKDVRNLNKLKLGKVASTLNNHETYRKRKQKKSYQDRRKKKVRYYTSESDSSTDSEMESSESDSSTDAGDLSYTSTSISTETSSSGDEKRRKRKRSKRDKHKHGKRKDRRSEKSRRRRDKKLRRRSRRSSESLSDSETENSSENDDGVKGLDGRNKIPGKKMDGNQSLVEDREAVSVHKKGDSNDIFEREEGDILKENGGHKNNDQSHQDRQPDVVDDHPGKSRSRSPSPRRSMSKSMSISPRSLNRDPSVGPKHSVRSTSAGPKRSPSRSASINESPHRVSERSTGRARSGSSKSPARSLSQSPVRANSQRGRTRSPSASPPRSVRSPPRISSRKSWKSASRSPVRSSQRSVSRSPVRPSRRSASRSPVRPSRKSVSRSPVRSDRRSFSRSPVRSARRSISRSSGRAPSRSPNPSLGRGPSRNNRRSYSRSPVSVGRRGRSPISDHGRSSSRSPVGGSPKRIRRGRGFSERYSYARRYRSRSPDRSPVRSYRYQRSDRDRYSSYRRSPRRYRSPPRGRTPPRYRSRRSRSYSASRSPIRYRSRRDSRNPIRSPSPVERYRASPRVERQRLPSQSRSRSRSRSESNLVLEEVSRAGPRNVVITGSTRGLGKALAREFLLSGDRVVVTSRSPESVDKTIKELEENLNQMMNTTIGSSKRRLAHAKVVGIACDVSQPEDVRKLGKFAADELGSIDIWVNNAGTNKGFRPLLNFTDNDIQEIVSTNLIGSILCTREAMQIMASQHKGGHVFNMDGAGSGGSSTPLTAVYGSTKCGLRQLQSSLFKECKRSKVGVHTASPGMVLTDLLLSGSSVKNKQMFNIICELPETVARTLVPRMRIVKGSGKAINYLTPPRILIALVSAWLRRGRWFDDQGRAVYAAEADRLRNWAESRTRLSFTDAMETYTENTWVSVFSLSVVCAFIILSSTGSTYPGT